MSYYCNLQRRVVLMFCFLLMLDIVVQTVAGDVSDVDGVKGGKE